MSTRVQGATKGVLFVGNDSRYFCSHRLGLARALLAEGHTVSVALPSPVSAELVERFRDAGIWVHEYPFVRGGMSPIGELRSLLALLGLYRRLRPDVVHHLTVKPILYGGVVGRLLGVPARIHAVLGLGYLFFTPDLRARVVRWLLFPAFRWALGGKGSRIIVQNSDDLSVLREHWMLGRRQEREAVLIRGSGVDVAEYSYSEPVIDPPIVLFAGRLTRAKGIDEFVAAASIVSEVGVSVRFVVCGGVDADNPGAVSEELMHSWVGKGVIEWWGYRDDLNRVLADASVVVLPSRYGEGVPRILIEAAAAGRAIVTTSTPGCRDIVQDGVNGILVKSGDPVALARAIQELLRDPLLRRSMGIAGRRRVEEHFSLAQVIRQTLELYAEMLRST